MSDEQMSTKVVLHIATYKGLKQCLFTLKGVRVMALYVRAPRCGAQYLVYFCVNALGKQTIVARLSLLKRVCRFRKIINKKNNLFEDFGKICSKFIQQKKHEVLFYLMPRSSRKDKIFT